MYLMTCTRPDLAYPLSILARYVAPGRHRPEHMAAAKRVLRYLCSTSGLGLVLGGRRPVVLTGHADASWADDQATQRSSQGYTFSLGSGSVSWRSTRSSSVLSSSCEAKIYAGAMAALELRWLTYLLTDLGEPPRSPPVLYVDNKAMLALCREHRLEHRTKHIALRYFFGLELQQGGQLRLAYVASEANTADIFTKALPPGDHQRFCTMLACFALLDWSCDLFAPIAPHDNEPVTLPYDQSGITSGPLTPPRTGMPEVHILGFEPETALIPSGDSCEIRVASDAGVFRVARHDSAIARMDPFARLPDDLLLAILSRVGSAARDVTRAAMTCRQWNEVTRIVPALCVGASAGGADAANQAPYLTFERQASRVILRTQGLRQLTIISPPAPPANHRGPSHPSQTSTSAGCHGTPTASGGGPMMIPSGRSAPPSRGASASAFCRRPSYSTESEELPACANCASCPSQQDSASGGASAQSPPPRHLREFIFEAWMRHVGPSLHSLTLSRALPATNSAKRPRSNGTSGDGGGGSVVVAPNLWEEDASLHLMHISRHCTNLRSLSLGHVSLSAPTLLATLKPMPALQHLSFSWLHASPAALHAVLDAAPNLLHLTIFMASGFPYLELCLPPSLQHLSLSYIRADSVALLSARSLQSLSIRDMFLSALTIRDAPNLRHLSVASANCLLVSAPHSSRLVSIDLRTGSLNWPATETLISTNWAALETLSLDFFATSSATGLPSVSSLPWLARNCPELKSLRLGVLAWQNMVDSAAVSGLLQSQWKCGSSGTLNNGILWPRLEVLTVRIVEKTPEGLLLLHSILSNVPTLMDLHVTVEGEEDEEEEEEEEVDMDETEYDGECDATGINEYEEEEGYHMDRETNYFSSSSAQLSVARSFSDLTEPSIALPRFTQPVGYCFALTAAERQHQLFLKGLDCLQRRSNNGSSVTSPSRPTASPAADNSHLQQQQQQQQQYQQQPVYGMPLSSQTVHTTTAAASSTAAAATAASAASTAAAAVPGSSSQPGHQSNFVPTGPYQYQDVSDSYKH
ncbi:unnamed protein product [Closterium sp. NIES-53]